MAIALWRALAIEIAAMSPPSWTGGDRVEAPMYELISLEAIALVGFDVCKGWRAIALSAPAIEGARIIPLIYDQKR